MKTIKSTDWKVKNSNRPFYLIKNQFENIVRRIITQGIPSDSLSSSLKKTIFEYAILTIEHETKKSFANDVIEEFVSVFEKIFDEFNFYSENRYGDEFIIGKKMKLDNRIKSIG